MTIRDLYETLLTMIGCGATTKEENETMLCHLKCLIKDGYGNYNCALFDDDEDFHRYIRRYTH